MGGSERVVVVFPATLDTAVVTAGNMPVAVYRGVQESAFETHREFGAKRAIKRRKFAASGQADLMANAYAPAIEETGGEHWWAGLYP